jgi:hypothetical protein
MDSRSNTAPLLCPCAAMAPPGPVQPSAVYATLLLGCRRPEAVIGVETLGLCYTHMRVRRFIRLMSYSDIQMLPPAGTRAEHYY